MDHSDNPSNFYANNVSVLSSLYDVTLQFTIQTPVQVPSVGPQPGNKLVIEQGSICNVRMSPQHAKALVAILSKHIQQYETQFGIQLPLTPELKSMWEEHIKEGSKQ